MHLQADWDLHQTLRKGLCRVAAAWKRAVCESTGTYPASFGNYEKPAITPLD